MQGVLSFGGTPFCFPCKKILEGTRMKCTQCGTEFEGNFCPVCGTRAQTAESAGAGQSAGQAAQAAGMLPQGAGQNLAAQAPPQGESAVSSVQPSVTDAPPEKLPRPKKSPLVASRVFLWMSDCLIFAAIACFLFSVTCPGIFTYVTGIDALVFGALLLCAVIAPFIILFLVYMVYPWGTRAHKTFLTRLYRQKARSLNDLVHYKKEKQAIVVVFIMLWIIEAMGIVMALLLTMEQARLIAVAAAIIGCMFLIVGTACVAVWWNKHRKAFMSVYYGKEKPTKNDMPVITYAQTGEILQQYQANWDNYILNKYRRRRYKQGKTSKGGEKYLTFRTVVIKIFVNILVLAVIVACFFGSRAFMNDIFRQDKVLLVEIGMDADDVEYRLGEPYEKNEDAARYVYYSDNYVTLLERNKNFDISSVQDWNDLENAFADAQALYTTEYAYIEVQFELTGSLSGSTNWWNTAMRSIFFDPSRTERTRDNKKNVRERDVTVAEIEQGASVGTAVVTVHYDDGSIWRAEVSGTLAEGSADTVGETVTLSCYDPYATPTDSTFTVQATVVEAADEPDAA